MYRPVLLAILPLAFAGCVTAHPITLGSDHPANPQAAAAPPASAASMLAGYQPAERFTATPTRAGAGDAAASTRPTETQVAHDGHDDAHGVGVVNSVNPAGHKINVTHEPMPTIGWPSMTMDFDVAPAVDLAKVKPGDRVDFTIEKGSTGIYEVRGLKPAARK